MKPFFKLHRRPVSQRGMQPLAVINLFDEVGKSVLDISQSPVFPEIDLLGLQGFDEALGGGVVVRGSLPRHADSEAVLQQRVHVGLGSILNPPVGVVDDPIRGVALRNGHPKSL